MRKSTVFATLAVLAAVTSTAFAQAPATTAEHRVYTPDNMTWGPGPLALPPGATMTVLSGDPSKPGWFTLRSKMPAGYTIPPHWHPMDEHLSVISGAFAVGMGDKFDPAAMEAVPAGGFTVMPAQMRHYARAKVDTILQVHAMGPFTITYVNPADDPRGAAPPAK